MESRRVKRKKVSALVALLALAATMVLPACSLGDESRGTPDPSAPSFTDAVASQSRENDAEDSFPRNVPQDTASVIMEVGDASFTVLLEENSSAREFAALLSEGALTLHLQDYGKFEKVGPLGATLSTNDQQITTQPGDIILYQGNQITVYYDTNTWSLTRLGHIENVSADELRTVLDEGAVDATFSLA